MIKIGPLSISFKKDDNTRELNLSERGQNKKGPVKNFLVKASGLIRNYSYQREGFEFPDYNLNEIKIASISDSYIKTALGKYSNLIFKAGYTLKGDNQKALDYINTRWKIMNISTRQPMNILFEGVAKDLVTYGNCFITKTRVNSNKINIKAIGLNGRNPVGGYFRIPPETVMIKRDHNGNVIKYRQVVNGEEKEYHPDDIIHIFIDKDANSAFGTPRIQAALEDVKMLRRIEGNVLSLIYRFSEPIYHWKIGIPEQGFQASNKEIDEARAEIERTSLDGMYITNEKTEIKTIGAEGSALDATGYLNYFEARVFSALEVSNAQMGRDSTKANADSVETQIHDTVKYMQRMIKEQIENQMITELLLEGGFNPILKNEDMVSFNFEEISLDTKVKIENHELMKYQSNLITLEEARKAIGKEQKVDTKKLYQTIIVDESAKRQSNIKVNDAIKLSREQHELQMKMKDKELRHQSKMEKSRSQTIKSDIKEGPDGKGMLGNGTPIGSKPNNSSKNMANPENQHGVTSVKIQDSKNNLSVLGSKIKDHENTFKDVYNKYDSIRIKIANDKNSKSYKKKMLKDGFDELYDEIIKSIERYSIEGMRKAKEDYINKFGLSPNMDKMIIIDYDKLIESLREDLDKISDDIYKGFSKDINGSFDTFKYRIRFLLEYFCPKSYYYSYLSSGKHFGVSKARVIFNEGSKDIKKYDKKINMQNIEIDGIPAFHAFCECSVEFLL